MFSPQVEKFSCGSPDVFVHNSFADAFGVAAGECARREKGVLISTNSVESYFAIVKRGHFGVYHHWSRKYLGHYLREFDWRYNVRGLPDMERTVIALKMTAGKRLVLRPPAEA